MDKPTIIGICGLQGAGKTTIAEGLCTPNETPTQSHHIDILSYITDIIHLGFPDWDRMKLMDTIHKLLKTNIDPNYRSLVNSHGHRFYSMHMDATWEEVLKTSGLDPATSANHQEFLKDVRRFGSGNNFTSIASNNIVFAREIFFSYAVKLIAAALFDFPWELICASTPQLRTERETTYSNIPYSNIPGTQNGCITARRALEYIGTDVFRKSFDPNTWLNITFGMIERMHNTRYVFISDTRFLNEAEVIKRKGGRIIIVHRKPEDLQLIDDVRKTHISNWGFLEFPKHMIDNYIHNNGSIDDLIEKVKKYLEEISS